MVVSGAGGGGLGCEIIGCNGVDVAGTGADAVAEPFADLRLLVIVDDRLLSGCTGSSVSSAAYTIGFNLLMSGTDLLNLPFSEPTIIR